MWSGVAAGAVTVDPNHLPHWFNDMTSGKNEAELTQPWRLDILGNLKKRIEGDFSQYEKANDSMSSWVKSGEVGAARVNMPFEDCLIELEWISVGNGMDSGTLTILNSDGVTTKMQFPLNQITCVMCCSEPGELMNINYNYIIIIIITNLQDILVLQYMLLDFQLALLRSVCNLVEIPIWKIGWLIWLLFVVRSMKFLVNHRAALFGQPLV